MSKMILDKAGIKAQIRSSQCVRFYTDSSEMSCHIDYYDAFMHMLSRAFFAGKEKRNLEISELLWTKGEESSNTVRESNVNFKEAEEALYDRLTTPRDAEEFCEICGIPYGEARKLRDGGY